MVGEASDLHVVAVDGDDAFHHTDVHTSLLQHAALFDVQFQIAATIPMRVGDSLRVCP
jgi:hypothetical protein